jgi:tRNA pseudouridine synthase 10
MDPLPQPLELIPKIAKLCLEVAEGSEFTTYLVGVRGKRALGHLPKEEVHAFKSEIKWGVGTLIGDLWEELGRRPDFQRPELLMIYDLDRRELDVARRSVFVYGRYRKLDQDLPQTRAPWRCRECDRDGCDACDQTGLRYPKSVEDLIGGPIAIGFGVEPRLTQLHGMGREDIDVRCLGQGRPFVLEVKSPILRTANLEALAKGVEDAAAGRVELPSGLRMVAPEVVARVKGWVAGKVYLATCEPVGDEPFETARIAALDDRLTDTELAQRTPERVSRRRADMIRRRRVRRFTTREESPTRFEAEIDAESGTYIKELISGDGGRTTPSVSEILGVPCVCARLDVLAICATDEEILANC